MFDQEEADDRAPLSTQNHRSQNSFVFLFSIRFFKFSPKQICIVIHKIFYLMA